MTTTTEQPITPLPKRRKVNTEPYGGATSMAILAILVTLIGFWRSFFSILDEVSLANIVHGASSTGWLVLVLVQATLIRTGHFKWHRVLGWSSIALFVVLLASSWHVLAHMLSGKSDVPYEFAKLFALSDVMAVPLMIVAYVAAIYYRKDRHLHSRLISITLLGGLLPPISRMFNLIWTGRDGLIFAMNPTYLFVIAILAVVIYTDWKQNRLRWPFPFAAIWFLLSYAILFPAWKSHWFDVTAKFIGSTA